MLSSFVDGIDKSGMATASFGAAAGKNELVVAAKNGNEEAFEILLERDQRKIVAVAWRFTRIHGDAEEITGRSFQK